MRAIFKKWKRWEKCNDEAIVDGIANGLSASDVAAATGRRVKAVYERVNKLGLSFQPRGNNQYTMLSPQQADRLKELLMSGYNFTQACTEMDLDYVSTQKKVSRQFGSVMELKALAKAERENGVIVK